MENTSNGSLDIQQIARDKIKDLIKKYNLSGGTDQDTLKKLLDYLGKTPLFLAFAKGLKPDDMKMITLTVSNTVFVPIFTSMDEVGKIAENADIVLMKPGTYLPMILEKNRHAVINPFGEYFLLWPELIREHMLPYIQEYEAFAAENFSSENFAAGPKFPKS
ncbi:MAG: SseB family protein [Clostridia bacterium]|nr:SseB family protein [Clostridia bacterium]